jgi:hypothetical protein
MQAGMSVTGTAIFRDIVGSKGNALQVARAVCPREEYDGSPDFSWDFGDGSTDDASSSAQVSHSYAATGAYTLTLMVTDQSQ